MVVHVSAAKTQEGKLVRFPAVKLQRSPSLTASSTGANLIKLIVSVYECLVQTFLVQVLPVPNYYDDLPFMVPFRFFFIF